MEHRISVLLDSNQDDIQALRTSFNEHLSRLDARQDEVSRLLATAHHHHAQPSESMTVDELRASHDSLRQASIDSIQRMAAIEAQIFDRLTREKQNTAASDERRTCTGSRLAELLATLSELLAQHARLAAKIRENHAALIEYRSKRECETDKLPHNQQQLTRERDSSFGLAKLLLANLQACRLKSEQNTRKLRHSSDLMFHTLYKIEDHFLKSK